ncbi:MAG: hypothetical protein GY866_11220 [Proteobacteria bacterium]|nr:hypothetical protein [Pseudomonadota bacterium]
MKKSSPSGGMSARERIMAALNRQPVDRIPFVPLIDVYTLMDMPPEIVAQDLVGQSYHQGIIVASKALECDLMIRHVPNVKPADNFAPHLQTLGSFVSPVEVKTDFKDDRLIETLTTPIGSLTGIWRFTDRAGGIPHPIKRAVTNSEELEIFQYVVDHLNPEHPVPDDDVFLKIDDQVGQDGIATVSVSNSPFMYLIEMASGLDNTYYLLQDHRDEVEAILDKLHASLKRYVEVIAAGPAKVVIQYENTSSTLLSPDIFRRYCLPYLNEYADILKSAGKIFLIHMCGLLQAFVDDMAGARFAGIADITPEPTGNLPLDEAAARLPGKLVLGGIDPITFIDRDTEAVEREISGLIERIKPYPGVLLGSADTTPRGTPPENFRVIRSLVDSVGAYT